MTTTRLCLALLLTWVSVPIAHARLGETEADLEKRFGKPLDLNSQDGSIVKGTLNLRLMHINGGDIDELTKYPKLKCSGYRKDDWVICVLLYENKSATEIYVRPGLVPLTEKDALQILEANAGAGTWRRKELQNNGSWTYGEWELVPEPASNDVSSRSIAILKHTLTVDRPVVAEYIAETQANATKQKADRDKNTLKGF